MRTEIIKRTLYTFNELDPEIQEKAIEKLWDINVDFEWWDGVYDDANNIGARIDSFDIGRGRSIGFSLLYSADDVAEAIIKDHGKSCETYQTAAAFLPKYKAALLNAEKYAEKLEDVENLDSDEWTRAETLYDNSVEYWEERAEELEEEFLQELSAEYLAMLRREYDYLTSEEAIRETIEANEYEFTEAGELA